jgi:hypothetical protein
MISSNGRFCEAKFCNREAEVAPVPVGIRAPLAAAVGMLHQNNLTAPGAGYRHRVARRQRIV